MYVIGKPHKVIFLPPVLTFPSCSSRVSDIIRSIKMLKRVGGKRHTCLTPTVVLNHFPIGLANFSDHVTEIIVRYGHARCGVGVLRRFACLVADPVSVGVFAFLFGCTTVGRVSNSALDPACSWLFQLLGVGSGLICCLVIGDLTGGFLLLRNFNIVV